jgi:hypothetical protein
MMNPCLHRNLQLGTNAIRTANEDRILVPRRSKVEGSPESTNNTFRTRSSSRFDERFYSLNEGISGID